MAIQFRNLVFEGGGVKGIGYIGALQVFEQRDLMKHIIRFGGTSAGAINALILSLGYTNKEQLDILKSLDFNKFMDKSIGIVPNIGRLLRRFGWHRGDFFSGWIGELIEEKLGNAQATFGDLKESGKPALYVIGTNLATGYSEVFSAERQADMPIALAVRISMSIPVFFASVRYGNRRDVYVDGGIQLNYPVKLFDREKYIDMKKESYAARKTDYYEEENEEFLESHPGSSPYVYNRQTLGLRLDTREEIGLYRYNEPLQDKPIRNVKDYARSLIGALMKVQENQHLHSDDWERTVYIDTLDIGTVDFNLSDERKEALLNQGIEGAKNYFKWFDRKNVKSANKIR